MNQEHYMGTATQLPPLDRRDHRNGCDHRGNPTRTARV